MNYSLNKISRDDVLAAIGLQSRRTTADLVMPALGLLGIGIVVGAGLGVLFAPKSGAETREAIGNGVGDVARRVKGRIRRTQEQLDDVDLDGIEDVIPASTRGRNGATQSTHHTMPAGPKA